MSIKILNGIDVDNGVLYTDTSNNRVGINTSSPQVPLEAKYTGTTDEILRIVGAASGKPQMTFYNDSTLHTKIVAAGNNDFSITNTHSTGDMFFGTGGATRLHIEANGNVGIGTTIPSTKLHLADSNDVYLTLDSTNTSTAEEVAIKYSNFSTGSNYWWEGLNQSANYSLAYGTSYSGANVKVEISPNGRATFTGKIIAEKGVEFTGGTIAAATTVLHTNNVVYARGGSSGMFLQNADGSDGIFIANDHVRVETGTAERMRITSTGNVGIGTTNPQRKLEVVGKIRVSDIIEWGWGGVGIIGSTTTNDVRIKTWNGSFPEDRLIVNGSGNVGIGTTSPGVKLEVNGGNDNEIAKFLSTDDTAQISISDNDTDGFFGVKNGVAFISQTAGTPVSGIAVDSSGNVGIGTISPSEKLEVVGAIKMSQNASYPLTIKHNSGTSTNQIDAVGGLDVICSSNNTISFKDSTTTNMTISGYSGDVIMGYNTGKVGIGTASPTDKLTVENGNIRLNSTSSYPSQGLSAYWNNNSPNMGGISWHQNPGFVGSEWYHNKQSSPYTLARIRLIGDASSGGMFVNLNNSDVFTIKTSTGNAGIGVTNPSEKLEVNGAVKATATTDAYKGYIKQNVISYGAEKVENSNYYFTSYNTTATVTSAQAYNRMVAAYDGRVKKVYVRHGGGSTPTATAVNFKKHVNNVTSATTYAATVANTASTNMTAYYEFADSDFTFNAGDLIGLLYQTTEPFGTSKTMGGVAITITLEYNIT